MKPNKKILVISPHPDDETLGCAGTLLKHKEKGDKIYWLIVTNGTLENGFDESFVNKRKKEIKKVSSLYGFEKTISLDFPPIKLDRIDKKKIIDGISSAINEIKPNVLYLPNASDPHFDHLITFQCAYISTKNFRYPFIKKILMYEAISETEFSLPNGISFVPNVFSDISKYFSKKIKIMNVYKDTELMQNPFPRSLEKIEALAKYRGARIGKEYAEAFSLIYEES